MKKMRLWVIGALLIGTGALLFAMEALLAQANGLAGQPAGPSVWLSLAPYATGLEEPVGIAFTGDLSDTRMFVVERRGQIEIVEPNGTIHATPFLSITDKISEDLNSYGEEGLLGLAFDPDYSVNGRFYVYYTDLNQDLQLSRFGVSGDPDVANATETPLLTIPHPNNQNHNGGQLAFGQDGFLYLGPGDGGGGGDGPNNAQNLDRLLGKILRLDVSNAVTYTIPASNPFTQTVDARPEIWAWGMRNPWRFSFDRGTGDLYIGDVGQEQWEEIDHQPAASTGGENYGWRCFEGTHDYNQSAGCPGPYVSPVAEYSHDDGNGAVTGGYVYRGSVYPGLVGYYVYADYVGGQFWVMQTGTWTVTPMLDLSGNPTSFGQDATGELYVAEAGGTIYRVVGPTPPPPVETPYWLPFLTR